MIYCSEDELANIRRRAELEHRTVSGYVLNIVMRAVAFEELVFSRLPVGNPLAPKPAMRSAAPRTTMLLRCSTDEALRIRAAVKRRNSTISGFVRHALTRSWNVADGIVVPEQVAQFLSA